MGFVVTFAYGSPDGLDYIDLTFARVYKRDSIQGGDINAFLGDVNLMLAGFHQGDQRPIFADRNSGSLQGGVAQLEYTIFPWLVPAARYEVFRQTLPPDVKPEMGHHLTLGINMLARADVYVRVVGRLIAERGDSLAAKDVTLIAGWAL